MSSRRNSLTPPERTNTEDPGAHDLDSESDDHFSDAHSVPAESSRASPIPKTRVEKVSDEPSYGEVPGTEAYRKREGDAEPDEIAIIADDSTDRGDGKTPASGTLEAADRPRTPGGKPIPVTVLESADGDGAKTPDGKKHESDTLPDVVLKADVMLEGSSTGSTAHTAISSPALNSPDASSSQAPPTAGTAAESSAANSDDGDDENDEDDLDDFGDDFDEFEQGGAGGDVDDFGDFDDGFEEAAAAPPPPQQPPQPPRPAQAAAAPLPFPIPDFEDLDADDVLKTAAPYLNGLYSPGDGLPSPPQLSNSVFLTPRSASLWSQLVAPPPLQPPDWIRSRIRRLFLVSLGVPVDLDEILPASKQKKLILPSLSVRHGDSPRTSTDSRANLKDDASASAGAGGAAAANSSVARLKQSGANGSNSSVDSQGRPASSSSARRKRKGPPPPPDVDLVAGQQLCATTDEALDGMTDAELAAHVKRLETLEVAAKEVLDYWTKRTDEKIGDREAFEGVIESLVAHARKTRK